MGKPKLQNNKDPMQILKCVKDDIKELDWEKIGDDKRTLLIAKADVLEIINDWIEYLLSPVGN